MTKKGRIGNDERMQIESLLPTKTDEEIAETFQRTVESIERIRIETQAVSNNPQPENEYVALLHQRYFWPSIQQQLYTTLEKNYFEQAWASLYKQYIGSEVAHTDEMMIKDLIMLDIQLNRFLSDRRTMAQQVEQIKKDLAESNHIEDEEERMQVSAALRRNLSEIMQAQQATSRLGNDLQTKKDKKFEQLKATREQRFKIAEQSKTNFFERIKYLDERAKREEEGRKNELIRMSAAHFQSKLEKQHHFEDGEWEKPWLTPEAILREFENDEETHKNKQSETDDVD